MEAQKPTFSRALRGGLISGLIAMSLNVIWNFIAQSLGSIAPPNFIFGVIVSSIFPLLIGGVLYFLLAKYSNNGKMIFLIICAVFAIVSLYGPLQPVMPDGSAAPEGFPVLAIPMHFVAAGTAMWGIPKFSK